MKNFAVHAGFSSIFAMAGATYALAGEHARIAINDIEFAPPALTVHVGDTVEWINNDIIEHTATARNGGFDIAPPKGRMVGRRMTKVGTVEYYCRLHPNMVGEIHVVK